MARAGAGAAILDVLDRVRETASPAPISIPALILL